MTKLVNFLLVLSICIVATSCTFEVTTDTALGNGIQFEIEDVQVSEGFWEAMQAFQEKTQRVVDTLEADARFSQVEVVVKSDFNSQTDQNSSILVVYLYDEEASRTDEEQLAQVAMEILQKALPHLTASAYDQYKVSFLQDETVDNIFEAELLTAFEFEPSELVAN